MKIFLIIILTILIALGIYTYQEYENIEIGKDIKKDFDKTFKYYKNKTGINVKAGYIKIIDCKSELKNVKNCSLELELISYRYGAEYATINLKIIKSNNRWTINGLFEDGTLLSETKIYPKIITTINYYN
jgi:hypothetical protein